ncbi:MAG: PEP-CTERM sorting domain-containing protein [Acidobacteriota bacterium]|nr:PEP-CTERM sorting domain-containing protein [Acidobacteriota bacterium]
MKLLRCLFALTLVCALSGMAKADPVDFHMVVVDPSFSTDSIISLTPAPIVTFTACVPGEIPGTVDPYEGCASFENSTPSALTNLELVFPNNGVLNSQTPNCSPDPGVIGNSSVDFFQTFSCNIVGGNYILDFSDGNIPVGTLFTIAEDGVAPGDFPPGTLSSTNVTPEPSSILLMSTGALLLGAFFYSRRRNGLGSMGF